MNRALRRQQKKMQAKKVKSALFSGTVMERLQAGAALHKERKYLDAIKYYDSVLKEDAKNTDAMFLKGGSLVSLKKYDAAIDVLKTCLELNDQVAPAHHNIGLAYKEQGDLMNAIKHLKVAQKLDPSNKLTAFHLETAEKGNTDKSSPDYVKNLYDRAAHLFEDNLVNNLGYSGPDIAKKLLEKYFEGKEYQHAIDLGCGTGLMGEEIQSQCKHLKGVDLSDAMIAQAKKKDIYDELVVAPLVEFLEEDKNSYDFASCLDVFIYIKNVDDAMALIAKHLKKGAPFVYSIETLEEGAEDTIYVDESTHRHKQKLSYMRDLAKKNGFEEVATDDTPLRVENGKPMPSLTVLLKKK